MKIKSIGEVTAVRFSHNGMEMNFESTLPATYQEGLQVEPSNIAFFEFTDLHEIESMISMLKNFKQGCCDNIGRWHRV